MKNFYNEVKGTKIKSNSYIYSKVKAYIDS